MVKFVVIICGNFKVEKEELASAEAFGERVKLLFFDFFHIDHVPVASNVLTNSSKKPCAGIYTIYHRD